MNPQDKRRDQFIPIESVDGKRIGGLFRLESPNIDAAEVLTEWRNNNLEWFFDSRPVTVGSTLAWMERVTNNPSQSLFIIETEGGRAVGTYNYTILDDETVRLDNLIKGRNDTQKALIYGVEVALLGYLFDELGIKSVITETLAKNDRVNRLLTSVGFQIAFTSIVTPAWLQEVRHWETFHWQNTLPQYEAATNTSAGDRAIRIPEWAK